MWEMKTAHLIPNEETIKRGENDEFSLVSYFDRLYIWVIKLFIQWFCIEFMQLLVYETFFYLLQS